MTNRRDRHQRGLRGPLSLPNIYTGGCVRVPKRPTPAQYFLDCLRQSIDRIRRNCPEALAGVDIGIEDVPSLGLSWTEADQVPLAAAIEATKNRHARIVIYRRPLEKRARDRQELNDLVHMTLVEQLSALTLRPMHEIDPDIEEY